MQVLTAQELHNLAMNIAGKKLKEMGYEFVAVNSTLKKHPQFVLFKKEAPTIFVLVHVSNNIQQPEKPTAIWLETFKQHALKSNAKVWLAAIAIANAESVDLPVFKDKPYYVAFDGFEKLI